MSAKLLKVTFLLIHFHFIHHIGRQILKCHFGVATKKILAIYK